MAKRKRRFRVVLGLFDPRRRGGEGGLTARIALDAVRERGFAARDLPTACGRYRVQLYNRQIRRDDDTKKGTQKALCTVLVCSLWYKVYVAGYKVYA